MFGRVEVLIEKVNEANLKCLLVVKLMLYHHFGSFEIWPLSLPFPSAIYFLPLYERMR